MAKPFLCSLVSKAGDRGATRSRLGHGHGRSARQWSCTVRDPVGQPVPAWHPSNGLSRSVVRPRTADRDRGGIGFSPPMVPVLCFLKAEEGTKEGDDEEVPPVSQRRERRRRGGVRLAAWAARGRARPACGCAWASEAGRAS